MNPFAGLLTGGKSGGGAPGGGGLSGLGGRLKQLETTRAAQGAASIQAAKRQKSVDFVNSQKGAKPIKPVGTFGDSGFGGVLSHVSDFATGQAKSFVKGIIGDSSAGETPTAAKGAYQAKAAGKPLPKIAPDQAGHSQSLKDVAVGAVGSKLALAGGTGTLKTVGEGVAGKVIGLLKAGNNVGKVTAASGGVQALSDANTKGKSAGQVALDVVKGTAAGYGAGLALGAGGAVAGSALGKFFNRGADAALKDAKAANPDAPYTGTKALAVQEPQKALGAGPSRTANASTATVPGTPGTPTHLPVSDAEYTQRFNALSKNYDAQSKAVASKGPLTQRIAQENIDQAHVQALDQLDHEYANGKPNPDYSPGTPDKTVQTGFVMGPEAAGAHADMVAATGQRAQLHQRIGQIDAVLKNVQEKGTTRATNDLRGLMRERQAAQDVLDGKKNFEDVYGSSTKAPSTSAPDRAIADNYNPNEVIPQHDHVPASELHPGARNVFAEAPAVAPGDVKGAPLNRNYVSSIYHENAAKVQQLASQLDSHDIKLIDQIESPTPMTSEQAAAKVQEVAQSAHKPQEFLDTVNAMKEGKDTRYLSDTAGLGRDMGYVQNHLTRVYEHDAPAASPYSGGANAVPGYAKNRVIATKAEAEALSKLTDENGKPLYPHLKLADVNAIEAHIGAMKGAAAEHGTQAFRQGFEQAHPGVVLSSNLSNGYKPVGVGGLTAPKEIANVYAKRAANEVKSGPPLGIRMADGTVKAVKDNEIVQNLKANPGSRLVNSATGEDLHSNKVARIVRNVKDNPVGGYDKVNSAVKTSVLGGGTFHAVTTAGTVAGQQLVRGILHPSQIPSMLGDNLRIIGSTFNKSVHDTNMARWDQKGVTDFAQKTGATLSNTGKLDVANPRVPVISQIHDAIFQRQIPAAKLTIIQQEMENRFPGMDFHNPTPEQLNYGRDVSSAVNNLGGINRAVEGMSPRTAKIVGRLVLAPDYTEGKFRTIANALNVTANGPKNKIAREMVVGKSLLFALPGLATLTAAGKINWNDPKDVAKNIALQLTDPQFVVPGLGNTAGTKTNPGGTPKSVHLPTTFISELGKIITPMFNPNGGSRLAGAESYATNREAALPSVATKLATNKDYYGNPIYGSDASGTPLGPIKTGLNIASVAAPIPVAQAAKQASGQQNLETTLLNTAGVRVAGNTLSPEATRSAAVTTLYNAFNPAVKQKDATAKKVQALIASGNVNQAHRVAQDWNSRLKSFDRKYPSGIGHDARTAWDNKWDSLIIKTSSRSDLTRQKNAKQNAALLNIGQ